LVKIHWRMLILECSQGYGRTEGSVTISPRNFVGVLIKSWGPQGSNFRQKFDHCEDTPVFPTARECDDSCHFRLPPSSDFFVFKPFSVYSYIHVFICCHLFNGEINIFWNSLYIVFVNSLYIVFVNFIIWRQMSFQKFKFLLNQCES
jgi:hypothetical protein